jgi:hypothetical protein
MVIRRSNYYTTATFLLFCYCYCYCYIPFDTFHALLSNTVLFRRFFFFFFFFFFFQTTVASDHPSFNPNAVRPTVREQDDVSAILNQFSVIAQLDARHQTTPSQPGCSSSANPITSHPIRRGPIKPRDTVGASTTVSATVESGDVNALLSSVQAQVNEEKLRRYDAPSVQHLVDFDEEDDLLDDFDAEDDANVNHIIAQAMDELALEQHQHTNRHV